MRTIFILICISFLFINCNGQNSSKSNEFKNSTELKGKIWHTGINRYGGSIVKDFHPNGNGFSDDIFLCFLDKDSIQLKHSAYSPSIGFRTTTIKGTYQVDNKNEVSIIFFEPKDVFNRHKVLIDDNEVQYSLYAINCVKKDVALHFDITELPQIKTYHFKIIEHLAKNTMIAELTLIDYVGIKYNFGKYNFDSKKEMIKKPK